MINNKWLIAIIAGFSISVNNVAAKTFGDIKNELYNRVYWFLNSDQLDEQLAIKIRKLQLSKKSKSDKALDGLTAYQKISSSIKNCRGLVCTDDHISKEERYNCSTIYLNIINLLIANEAGNDTFKLSDDLKAYAQYIAPKYRKSF